MLYDGREYHFSKFYPIRIVDRVDGDAGSRVRR